MESATLIHNLLHHLSAVLMRESDQILQEQLGLTFSQFRILGVLAENPALQQRQLAVNLGQTEASVSRQVKLLKKKGLLESRINPQNRREHMPVLTLKGERITEAAQDILRNFQQGTIDHMGTKDQLHLLALLTDVKH